MLHRLPTAPQKEDPGARRFGITGLTLWSLLSRTDRGMKRQFPGKMLAQKNGERLYASVFCHSNKIPETCDFYREGIFFFFFQFFVVEAHSSRSGGSIGLALSDNILAGRIPSKCRAIQGKNESMSLHVSVSLVKFPGLNHLIQSNNFPNVLPPYTIIGRHDYPLNNICIRFWE